MAEHVAVLIKRGESWESLQGGHRGLRNTQQKVGVQSMLGDSDSVKDTCVAGMQQAGERGRETELTEPSWGLWWFP